MVYLLKLNNVNWLIIKIMESEKYIYKVANMINNRVCPYCGGMIEVELKMNKGVLQYKVITECCSKRSLEIISEINTEDNNLLKEKLSLISKL